MTDPAITVMSLKYAMADWNGSLGMQSPANTHPEMTSLRNGSDFVPAFEH
jgi:hypothetical protein